MRLGLQRLKINTKQKSIPHKARAANESVLRNLTNDGVEHLAEIYHNLFKEFENLANEARQRLIQLELEGLDTERREILDLANGLFKDRRKAANWLSTPKEGLNHKTPLEAMNTEEGAEQVKEMLYRAEYGVFG
jgi:putative toxin-antitoxin system antitoxin component (TIGR02293 family)